MMKRLLNKFSPQNPQEGFTIYSAVMTFFLWFTVSFMAGTLYIFATVILIFLYEIHRFKVEEKNQLIDSELRRMLSNGM